MDRSERVKSLLILLAIIIVSVILANLVSGLLWIACGIDINEILSGSTINKSDRIVLRLGLMINHAGTFLLPAILFCVLFIKEKSKSYLRLDNSSNLASFFLWGFAILCSYPFIAKLTQWNMAIPLPEWMMSSQTQAFALLEQTLKMESPGELLFSILLVGVLASLGEELIFRGIIQEQLIRAFESPHKAIIISAFIFGGFHMQFERILPLSLLGLILGYSYYYSKSLFVPIVLHFLNNSFQIISIYLISRNGDMPAIDEVPEIHWSMVVLSLLLTVLLVNRAVRMAPLSDESRP